MPGGPAPQTRSRRARAELGHLLTVLRVVELSHEPRPQAEFEALAAEAQPSSRQSGAGSQAEPQDETYREGRRPASAKRTGFQLPQDSPAVPRAKREGEGRRAEAVMD